MKWDGGAEGREHCTDSVWKHTVKSSTRQMGQEQVAKPVMVVMAFVCRGTGNGSEGVDGDSSAGSRALLEKVAGWIDSTHRHRINSRLVLGGCPK